MIILSLFFFYGLKQPPDSKYQYVIYSVYTLGIIWSIASFNKPAGNESKFKEYFSAGFKTFIVVTLLMVVYTGIFYKINPSILEAKIELNNKLALQEGDHTAPEIESNANQMRSIFIPMMLAITTFIYLFLGALVSAVVSAVIMQMKKN